MASLTIQLSQYNENFDEDAVSVLGYTFLFSAGTYSAKAIVTGLGMASLAQAASALVYLGWFLVMFRVIAKNYNLIPKILLVEAIYLIFLAFNINTFSYTAPIFDEYKMFIRQILVVYIPCGVICSQIRTYTYFFDKLRIYGYIGTYMMFIAYLLGYVRIHGFQYLGVQVTPFVLILFIEFCKNKSISNIVSLCLSLLLILVGGRQSLVTVVISMVMIYIYINSENIRKIILTIILVLIFLLIFGAFYEQLLTFLISILENAGMNTKILSALQGGEFLSTSTRDSIYEASISVIQSKGAEYTGLFSGVYLTRNEGGSWIAYPHNLILEMLIDFGTVIGSILILILFGLILKNCLCGSKNRRLFMICLSSMVLVRLMVSSSYLIEGNFYVLLIILLMGHNDTYNEAAECMNSDYLKSM